MGGDSPSLSRDKLLPQSLLDCSWQGRVVTNLTRRSFLLGSLGIAGTLGLCGCNVQFEIVDSDGAEESDGPVEVSVGEAFTADEIEYVISDIRYFAQETNTGLQIFYTATNKSEEPSSFTTLPCTLYGPEGTSVNSIRMVTLDDFNVTTNDTNLLPDASRDDSVVYHLVGDGEYTLYIDDWGFEGELKFTVSNSNSEDGSEPKISY